MSVSADRRSHWPVFLLRALPALAAGLYITFSADHSAPLGLTVYGAFAIVTGAILAWGAFGHHDRVLRGVTLAQGILTVLFGAASLLYTGGGLGLMFLIFSAWAALTGFLELYLGLRARGRHPASRDWVTTGALTAIFALVVLLIPADLEHEWVATGKAEGVTGVLTADMFVVGTFGAYAVLLGVYLVIAGLSAKWARPASDKAAHAPTSTTPTGH